MKRTSAWTRFVELARNGVSRSLTAYEPSHDVQPICAELVSRIDDLRDLQKDYLTARGILRVSVPALSRNHRSALVEIMENSAENESLVYLTRQKGRWRVEWMLRQFFGD